MRIICIEEHGIDAAIAQALHQVQSPENAYFADWGSRVEDKPPSDRRPGLLPHEASLALGLDMGSGRVEAMDRHGVDMQVLSYSNPTQFAPAAQAVDLARAANDRLAEAVRVNPSRFGGFCTLPWQNPSAAAQELERAVKELGLYGTLIVGRPGATFLDDARYEPVLAKLDELGVPMYVHPGLPLPQVREPYYGGLDKEISARLSLFGWGWHNEAGIQVIRMILAGKFDRFPRLQVISGHWGEMVPFYLQRMDDTIPQEASRLSRSITETYKQHVWVTPSGMLDLPHFEFIHKVIGADRILYSIDYPYLTLSGAREFLESLPISAEEKEKIAHGNAEKLFSL